MNTWQLQDAKSRLSQLVESAMNFGPQFITKRGVDSVVVISMEKFNELTKPKNSLAMLLKKAPKADLDFSRSNESIRELEF
jgi:antitoxin Phd